jgi:hypothetical protein
VIDDPIVIGLKRLYDSVLIEPVPDDFMGLLERIDVSLAQLGDGEAQAREEVPDPNRLNGGAKR